MEETPMERYGRKETDLAISIEVMAEQDRQIQLHGSQSLPNGTGPQFKKARDVAIYQTDSHSVSLGDGTITWSDILLEEVYEALAETDDEKIIEELIQVAAVAQSWIRDLVAKRALDAAVEGLLDG